MFVVLAQVHKWTTYIVTALILGHVLVASGILPGDHGVRRSMHLGGRRWPRGPAAVAGG